MNQQRARRFRAAQDAKEQYAQALARGEDVKAPFDTNCITPGTEFMSRLSLQLRYFVIRKIQEDTAWQAPRIVLSGHEVCVLLSRRPRSGFAYSTFGADCLCFL
jgi:5'-3' exoribonuclease 1